MKVAAKTAGEASLTLRVSFPAAFPLQRAAVSCEARVGLSDAQWARLQLEMTRRLRRGSLGDALAFARAQLDAVFAGAVVCAICYAQLDAAGRLSTAKCRTCESGVFHKSCLAKWFSTSSDASCPLCRSTWTWR